nr:MAG TPA: hypothetical protein [Caudoviricetes sp.]
MFSTVNRLFGCPRFSPLPHRFNFNSHGFLTALCGFPAASPPITRLLKMVDTPFITFHCFLTASIRPTLKNQQYHISHNRSFIEP